MQALDVSGDDLFAQRQKVGRQLPPHEPVPTNDKVLHDLASGY
jgi:hypothetical protein